MNSIQEETERTLRTGNRIASVDASDALMERLKGIPSTVRGGYEKVPKKMVWAVAASIALLIALNVLSARDYAQDTTSEQTDTNGSYFDHLKTL